MKEAIELIQKELEKLNFNDCKDKTETLIMRIKIQTYQEILEKLQSQAKWVFTHFFCFFKPY